MSILWTPQGAKGAPKDIRSLSRKELVTLAVNLTTSLKNMSARAQMLACELHEVDSDNPIFRMSEGILDKEHLFYIRKSIKDGTYQKNRELARIND